MTRPQGGLPEAGLPVERQPEAGLPVERMCALAGVSRAGYYRSWRASAPRREETAVRDAVQRLALAHRHYGHRRIGALLRRAGWCVNHKRVLRLMREDNLLCLRRRSFVPPTTDARHGWRIYPNLAWRLQPSAPNQLWVADITYVRLDEAFAYLAVVLDAWSRRAVGWALASHLQASLALAALEVALTGRDVAPGGLVHHSDRGVQYACGDYISRLAAAGIQPSMSRVGCPYDNAIYTVTLPCTLWFLDREKAETVRADQVLFLDARHIYRQLDRAHRDFLPEQIELLANIVRLYRAEEPENAKGSDALMSEHFPDGAYRDVPGLCKRATLAEIEAQGWSLNPGRYVGVAPRAPDEFIFAERLEELNEELEQLNLEAHDLEERISENVSMLIEAA